ncbi:MAG: bacillithiol system redox-active protein YtxJ [Pyrinomonadaceae bacterium]
MNNHFANIADTKQLEDLIKQSAEAPVVVFKHSTACPVSAGAYEEMSAVTVPVNIVIVQEARDVSNQIEQVTDVEHHSPQVIVLRNGKAVWNASHWKIKAENVEEAVRQAG